MKDYTMYSKDINHSLINSNRCCFTHVQYVCTDVYMTGDCTTDWKAEWGRQSPAMKNQLLVHQAGFKYQWVSYLYFYMAYSANFDALNNTQMKTEISLGKEKRNLSQWAGGPNHTSGLTLISVKAPINWFTKHQILWLEVRALWSYWVGRDGFGLQFEDPVKCNSRIAPRDGLVGLQSGQFLLTAVLGAIFPLGSIVPVYQRVTTSNVEMGKFTEENFVKGNTEPLCLLWSTSSGWYIFPELQFLANGKIYQITSNRSGCSKDGW